MGEFGGSNSCVGKVCTKLYAAVALQHSGEVHLVTVSPNKSRNFKLRISRRPGDKDTSNFVHVFVSSYRIQERHNPLGIGQCEIQV